MNSLQQFAEYRKDYIIFNQRVVNGVWLRPLIRRGTEADKERKALEFFCARLRKNNDIEQAKKETSKRFSMPLVTELDPILQSIRIVKIG